MLLFRAGSFERLAVPLSLVARLEEFPLSAIEHAGGGQVVQYRTAFCRWCRSGTCWNPARRSQRADSDPVQVVVFNDGERSVGMVVDQILDIVEEAVTVRQKPSRKGPARLGGGGEAGHGFRRSERCDSGGRARLGFRRTGGLREWRNDSGRRSLARSRAGLIRSGLEMAGYRVVEAAD